MEMGEKDKVGLGKVQFYKIIEEADVWWELGGKNEALQRGEVYVEQKIRDGNRWGGGKFGKKLH